MAAASPVIRSSGLSRNDTAGDRLPSIEVSKDGVIRYARSSPSQIKTAKLCPRKWWYDKRAHLERKPPSKGQERGTEGHSILEDLCITGTDRRGQVELAGAHLLAPFLTYAPAQFWDRNPGRTWDAEAVKAESERVKALARLKVEESIGNISTPDGVVMVGFSDLMLPPGLLTLGAFEEPTPDMQGDGMGWVVDHKFKKDLDKYADQPSDLRNDPQAVIYGHALITRWPNTKAVRFVHHNYQTQGKKKALPIGITLTPDEIAAKWSVLCDFVDDSMAQWARVNTDTNVPHGDLNSACSAYGGCDFAAVCPSSPRNRFLGSIPGVTRPGITLEGTQQMGLVNNSNPATPATTPSTPAPAGVDVMAMIRNAQAQAGTAAPATPAFAPTPATPAPAPTPAPVTNGLVMAGNAIPGKLYHVGDQGMGKAVGQMNGQAVFTNTTGAMFMVPAMTPAQEASAQPETIPAPAPAPAPVAPSGRPNLLTDAETGKPVDLSQGAGAAINPPDANRPAANLAEKAAIEAATAAAQAQALGLATAAQPPAASPEAPAAPKAKRGRPPGKAKSTASEVASGEAQAAHLSGLILVIDSAVSGPVDLDLDPYVAGLVEAVCASQTPAIPDPRLADPKGPLGYGGWRGALAAAAKASAPTGLCTISRSELADPVIEALIPLAQFVIKGSVR